MKFAQQLAKGRVEEWRRAYLDYRLLKKLIKAAALTNADDDDAEGGGSTGRVQEEGDQGYISSDAQRPLNLPLTPDDSAVLDVEGNESSASEQDPGRGAAPPDLRPRPPHPRPRPAAVIGATISGRSNEIEDLDKNDDDAAAGATLVSSGNTGPGPCRPRFERADSSSSRDGIPRPALRKRAKSGGASMRSEYRWKYPPTLTLEQLMDRLNPQERKFFQVLDSELEKIEAFYDEREAEALARYKVLREQLDQLAEHRAEYLARQAKSSRFTKTVVRPGQFHLRHRVHPNVKDADPTMTDPAQRTPVPSPPTPTNIPSSEMDHRRAVLLRNHFNPENYLNARRKLKLAVFEFYKYLGYVKNYRLLNRTGFSKATKKMEKATNIKCQEAYMRKVQSSHFASSSTIDDLQSQTETMFGASFEKGSRKKALQRLRAFTPGTTSHHFASWRAGLLLGLSVPAIVDGIVKACHADTHARIPAYPALLQLYGAMVLPLILAFGVGVNLIGWTNAHINIPLIFYFDTRTHIDYREYLEIPCLLLCSLSYCFWLSLTVVSETFTPQVWPLVWFFSTIIILFNPLPVFHKSARWWIIRSTLRVMTAGLVRVEFRDFWLGDQFVSLYYTAYTLGLLVCTYTHRWRPGVNSVCSTNETWASAILASLPSLWRLGQSFRRYHDSRDVKTHLVNAGKYSAGVLYFFLYFNYRIKGSKHDATFATFVVFASVNSSYSYVWDIIMDWNLLNRGSRHFLLRNELAYRHQIWFYYFAMCTNLLLRFSWVLYLFDGFDLRLKGFIVALLETFRRWQWNFIRVESEHVGNVDGFRVTRDVPLPYTISQPGPTDADPLVGDDGSDEDDSGGTGGIRTAEQFPVEKRTGEDGAGLPESVQEAPYRLGRLLPGELGRKLRSIIAGTSSRAFEGESDDEDEEVDSPTESPNGSKTGREGNDRATNGGTARGKALPAAPGDRLGLQSAAALEQRPRL